jgi:uncharacterized protein
VRLTTVCAISIVILGAARFAVAQTGAVGGGGSGGASAQIATTAVGDAQVSPDRATIFVGVQSRGASAAAVAAENARRQRAILDTLRALGISGDRVSTASYSVSPEMQYNSQGQAPPRVIGYTVSNTIRADVQRLDDIGRVIDAALAKGANDISGLQLYSSKADSARRAALATAVSIARADAESLARAAGGTLGSLLELSTSEYPTRPVQQVLLARMTAAQAGPTPIESGQQTVSATVAARWAFLPTR